MASARRMSVIPGVVEELARGWMSLGGILNTHVIITHLVATFGTDDQKKRYMPQLATAERRGALTITEPNAGSDVQAIQSVGRPRWRRLRRERVKAVCEQWAARRPFRDGGQDRSTR